MTNWGTLLLPDGSTLLDALKLFLGIDPSDTTNDDQLNRALDIAGNVMETYFDRVLAEREITEQFTHHFDTVVLHDMPTSGDVTVTKDGVVDTGYSWYKARGGMTYLTRSGFRYDVPMDWRRFDQVDVTYTAGFNPIPVDLGYGITSVAADIYAVNGTGAIPGGASGDMKQIQLYDVGSVSYDTGGASGGGSFDYQSGIISETVAQMLQSYRRMST